MNQIILPISIIPPIPFFVACASGSEIIIDGGENYQKQSIRNRYHILSANGVLPLTVNVTGQKGEKIPTGQITIDYDKHWVREHLRAIESAYRSAPFFEHYFPEIQSLIETKYFNMKELFQISFPKWLKMLKLECNWLYSESFVETEADLDLRIPIKRPSDFPDSLNSKKYIQVFSDRFAFQPNLSIIDLLMNQGPAANTFLPKGME